MRALWVCLAVALVAPVSAAKADLIRSWDVRGWEVGAYTGDDGAFSHCVISAEYRSGITLHFALQLDWSWTIGFDNSDWSLRTGDQTTITLGIDGRREAKTVVDVRTDTLVAGDLPDSPALFERMQRGRVLEVTAGGEMYRFSLDGSSAALSALLECRNQYDGYVAAPSNSGKGFSGSGSGSGAPPGGKQKIPSQPLPAPEHRSTPPTSTSGQGA